MGFVKVVPPDTHPPCPVPFITRNTRTGAADFGVGTVWKCDKCGRHWELKSIPARGQRGKWDLVEAE